MNKNDPKYIHYANANLLRELAEKLPTIIPDHHPDQIQFLNRLADEELEQAQYDEWVRAKISEVDLENTKFFTTDEVLTHLAAYLEGKPRVV